MKKIFAAALALLLLATLSTATASEAGTITDPLITRSYADGIYSDSVIKAGVEVVDERLSTFMERVSGADRPYAGLNVTYTRGWEPLASQVGHAVTLVAGSSFMLTFGNATLEVTSGEVIDVSAGTPVPSGTALRQNARYFCAEDTIAVFRSVDGIAFMVDGGYSPDDGTSRQYQDYSDVLGLEWYTDPARYVRTNMVYHDYQDDAFRPQDIISRAELVHALWVACGRPVSDYVPAFTDLAEGWYVMAVMWAAEHGITAGMDEVTFAPDGEVNREQMAAMLFRCASVMGVDVSARADITVYSDWEMINDWGSDPISWATAVGYISGMNNGTMDPWGKATRAQAASVVMRYATLDVPGASEVSDAPDDTGTPSEEQPETPPETPPENPDTPPETPPETPEQPDPEDPPTLG